MGIRHAKNEIFEYEKSTGDKTVFGSQHYHDFHEIYFLEEGNCHYFIDDKAYDVRAGDVVLIPKGIIHKTMYDGAEHSRRLIYCSASYIPSPLTRRLSSMLRLYRDEQMTRKIKTIFDTIEAEYTAADEFSEEVILHHVQLLFYLLARTRETTLADGSSNAYASETIAFIKENYAEEIHLSDLARRCSVSPEHLSRVFKKETGFGISEYLSMVRLQQAQRLLTESPTLSIAKIADRCGYNDSNYFSEQFKKAYGVSPLRYRRDVNN